VEKRWCLYNEHVRLINVRVHFTIRIMSILHDILSIRFIKTTNQYKKNHFFKCEMHLSHVIDFIFQNSGVKTSLCHTRRDAPRCVLMVDIYKPWWLHRFRLARLLAATCVNNQANHAERCFIHRSASVRPGRMRNF